MFENRKYVIIDKDEVSSVDFSKVLETSADTLRYSLDGSKTFVKYNRAPAQAEVLYQVGDTNIPSGSSVGDVKIAAADEEEVPASVAGLTSKSQEYTHSEILNILTGSEWVDSSMPEK